MAAEVPVSDVLCEAMEYLSKLGSNLRTRSENLKEKRISREKLKNSHAVQKAASKVLLICELSKKSLDNVEAGVRKVLSLLEKSQAPVGGKKNDIAARESKHKYHYFEYQSRKLRIAKKIHLKHYTSVKVLARGMPVSMQDRYPVYYDCKLKRYRRKIAAKVQLENHKDNDQGSEKPLDSDNEQPVETSDVLGGTEEQLLDVDQKSPRPIEKCIDSHNKELGMIEKDTSKDECMDKTEDKNNASDSDPSDAISIPKKHKQRRHSKSVKDTPMKQKTGRIRVVDIYSSDSNEEVKQCAFNQDTNLSENTKNKDDCLSDNSNHEPNAKKSKLTGSDNSRSPSESDLALNKSQIDKKCSNKHDSDNDSTLSKQGTQNDSGGESKPVIRCVNLSKLLKPDVLGKSNGQQSYHKKVRRKKENNDDEFWAQKRKEVLQFKPKTFSINITRLPTMSVAFMLSNNLKKIMKGGKVICKLSDESETPNTKKMKAAKNALLNDSESDECRETQDAMKVKKSLLKDSDSEHKISEDEHVNKPDKNEKRDRHNKSSSEKKTAKRKKSNDSKSITTNNENQEDNCHETPKLDSIDEDQIQNANEESDIQANANDPVTSTKTNETIKAALLNDMSDEDFAGFSNNDNDNSEVSTRNENNDKIENQNQDDKNQSNGIEPETPTKINQAVKSSLLNDSSDDDSAGLSKPDECSETPVEINNRREEGENHSVDDQGIVTANENELEAPTKTDEQAKSSLLNSSSEDPFAGFSKTDIEESTKTNENIKSSLLNDSSDEKSNKNEEESPTKVNQKVKSALLNDSSDVKSDSSDDQQKRHKTPKSKRKMGRKNREAKQKLRYSSSDSEQEKPKRHSRKKARSSSSSSSEDIKVKKNKTKKLKINSDSSDSNNKTIDQVDGAIDENSSSSVKKMVRSKAKPSGSSSQNSDNQDASDKDIDGLTNLNNLNKNRRREPSARSRQAEKTSSRSKVAPIIGEDLLKAESSSDVSEAEDNEIAQDLPEVTLSGLNGDHMAKDDLLGDSDSSVSHNDKDGSENPDNSEEENVKSTRRKANAISSDSDGGSNRRKTKRDEDDRMSDFEDSEAESSETGKKTKRKKKASDSDASVDSTDGKKKRKRIKVVNDSEEGSGSDTENEGRNKHGRKNIRKVMGKNQLEEATKKAAREEKERIARITERQKLYNNLDFDESGKPDEVVLEKVVLDFDPETKEPLIQVDRGLVKKLKPHQANGIKFMWDACFESVKRIKKDKGSGCILAHCMGLGKTLQVISLTHTLLVHGDLTGVNRVLVVCPLSTVLNWVNEIRMWLKHAVSDYEVDVYELSRYKQNSERAFQLQQWFDGGGVCVLGYEMFRNLSADNNKKFKKKMLKSFQESLVDPGPDLVVCDEGHLLKNEKTSLSQSMNRVRTLRRIVLTGTPLQNNLKEYYCMVQFVKPNLLGKYNEYLNRFVNPITNGQYTDSTEHDIRVMKRRSHVLHKMLDGAVQRRDYGVLAPFLPPKHEYVLFITLTEVQVKLYQYYLDNYSRRPLAGKSSGFLFPDFQSLQRIWTHPLVLKYNSERYEIMQQKKRDKEEEDSEGSLVDFIDDDSTPDESTTEESTDDSSDMSDDSRKKSKKNKKSSKKGKGKDSKGSRRGTRANPTLVDVDDEDNGADEVIEVKNENPTEWWIKLVEESEIEDMRNSHKLVLLFDILRQCETIGDKLLVFSQSLYSLDLIEHFLGKVDEATQEGRIDEKLGGHVGSWSPGVDYFRLDGSTSCENRSIWCKNFNREDNPRARLFLISTRAGGLGINLVAANRVVIFDVSWNPSHDVQSIFRVYRFGQKKPCYVYRFLAMGTMEEKIYERQVTKQAISKRVIDEQQIDRHYAENDLAELYKFEATPQEPRPLPTLPKDRLFAEMLKEHEAQIYKYHEHDSLLENKEEETLSEEERKAAWEDFENEKSRPPPAPFASAWPMHNGMVPGLLAQQQQQLAYAALAAMLRKDMPNINDNQIRDMLPLIYNSNPQLMQKMGEIYKYAQPGMMNPGMMNPVMNSGGSGGASGLQYEPPWQRQHQQQQQIRLQQLMQQQQNFYAGGLGSRDPIAMALQQQRAREMLMGGAASGAGAAGGRPRGRPPLRPPTTSQDVVNLDSD